MNWGAVAAVATLLILNVGAVQWLFNRHDSTRVEHEEKLERLSAKHEETDKEILRLRAALPLEYVRREDWIRFSNTLEAKLDAMRAEMRSELGELKGKVDGKHFS